MASITEFDVPQDRWTNQTWVIIQGLMVTFSTTGTVSPERFQKFLNTLQQGSITHLLSISEGSATIDSVQRKLAADIAKHKNMRIAVVIDSAITRGLITAFSWLGVNIKSYGPGKEEDALKYLGVPGLDIPQAIDAIQKLRDTSLATFKRYAAAK